MSAAKALRILIADDHEGYRREMRHTFARDPDIQIVDEVSNGAEAIRRVRVLRPHKLDLVLMDIDMPVMNGIEATAEIVASDPNLPVIILTVSTLDEDLFAGISSGAVGFLNKDLSPGILIRTLHDFRSNGSLPMSRIAAGKAFSYLQHHQAKPAPAPPRASRGLSRREREILTRIAGGAHDREIAAALVVAESTIKTHVRHILRKLGARNRAEAVARVRADDSRE
jgi:DNA-binding NarL/FixJ family response regulator